MTYDIHNSDLPEIKKKIYFFAKSYPGYTADKASKHLSIPLNVVFKAIEELTKEGYLVKAPTLRIGRRME